MYRRIKILTVIATLVPALVAAQSPITVDDGDMPNVGDTLRMMVTTSFGNIDPLETGAGHTWDFSGLEAFTQRVDTFVDPLTQAPPVYIPAFSNILDMDYFADLATPNQVPSEIPVLGIQPSDVYDFYKKTGNYYAHLGFGFKINGVPITTKIDPRDMIYEFPLNFQDISTSFSAYGFTIPTVGYYSREQYRSNTVDGWGTLITPYGTFDVLRVESALELTDSVYNDDTQVGITTPTTIEYEFKWLAKNESVPLLQINGRDFFGSIIVNEVIYRNDLTQQTDTTDTTSVNLLSKENTSLYPNPASDFVMLEMQAPNSFSADIDLLDLQGKVIKSLRQDHRVGSGFNAFRFSVDELPSGMYFMRIRSKSDQHLMRLEVLR